MPKKKEKKEKITRKKASPCEIDPSVWESINRSKIQEGDVEILF